MIKQDVHGNLTGLRDAVIAALGELYAYEVEEGAFLPRELMQTLAKFSTRDAFGPQFMNFLTDHNIRLIAS